MILIKIRKENIEAVKIAFYCELSIN